MSSFISGNRVKAQNQIGSIQDIVDCISSYLGTSQEGKALHEIEVLKQRTQELERTVMVIIDSPSIIDIHSVSKWRCCF
jgi:hypothetical protein